MAALVLAVALLDASDAWAKGGAFKSTKHGDKAKGPQRRHDQPRGSCLQCHDGHASHDRNTTTSRRSGLFADNDAELCFGCHRSTPLDESSLPDLPVWSRSAHAEEELTRPGSGARQPSTNPCVVCHNPHGVRDRTSVIPALLHDREQDLCIGCHDGMRGADIAGELLKPHLHASTARGAHSPGEKGGLDMSGQQSHASCSDCHNAHVARRDRTAPAAPDASSLLAGVSRVQVINGPAGTQPAYRWIAPSDPGPVAEFEICFKCHSSAAKQAAQREDIARTTNPANPSFHPIQAAGKNRIDPAAFAGVQGIDSRLRCTDCHSSDSTRVRGPHGSTHEHLLRLPADVLCLECHSAAVYAGMTSDSAILRASRFNAPAEGGHALHAGAQKIACLGCHEAHGSTRHPALLRAGTGRGIVNYSQTPQGGTCNTTCHTSRSYKVNYPR